MKIAIIDNEKIQHTHLGQLVIFLGCASFSKSVITEQTITVGKIN